jgi:hypothetical protein
MATYEAKIWQEQKVWFHGTIKVDAADKAEAQNKAEQVLTHLDGSKEADNDPEMRRIAGEGDWKMGNIQNLDAGINELKEVKEMAMALPLPTD